MPDEREDKKTTKSQKIDKYNETNEKTHKLKLKSKRNLKIYIASNYLLLS